MTLCSFCNEPLHNGGCDPEALKRVISELRESVRILELEKQAGKKLGGSGVVMITSLLSHRNQKPRIDIHIDELHTQMEADAAMKVAQDIIECCQGAYADGFIFHFLQDELKQPMATAAGMIHLFREYRENLRREFEEMQENPPRSGSEP
jgi:hypothetical protein